MTPTARTLAELRRLGFTAEVVERWVPRANVRRDLFGIGDVLAVRSVEPRMLLVQATSVSNVAARIAKAKALPGLAAWLRAGGAFEVWGWSRRGDRWEVRRVALRADDLVAVPVNPRPRRRPSKPAPSLFGE